MKRFFCTMIMCVPLFMACCLPVHADGYYGGGRHGGGGVVYVHNDDWAWGAALGLGLLGLGLWQASQPKYYYPPPVYEQPPARMYVQPVPQPSGGMNYWYYCESPQGYYPYVKRCPSGWLKVVPAPPPPGYE